MSHFLIIKFIRVIRNFVLIETVFHGIMYIVHTYLIFNMKSSLLKYYNSKYFEELTTTTSDIYAGLHKMTKIRNITQ